VNISITEKQFNALTEGIGGNISERATFPKSSFEIKKEVRTLVLEEKKAVENKGDKLHVEIQVPEASVTLIDTVNNLGPMVKFLCAGIDVSSVQGYDTSQDFALVVHTVTLSDERKQAISPFQMILVPQSASKEPIFSVKYSRDSQRNEKVQIAVDSPLVTLVPETIMATKEFLEEFVKAYRSLEKSLKSLDVHPSDLPPDIPLQEGTSHVTCQIVNMRAKVVALSEDPRGLIA